MVLIKATNPKQPKKILKNLLLKKTLICPLYTQNVNICKDTVPPKMLAILKGLFVVTDAMMFTIRLDNKTVILFKSID